MSQSINLKRIYLRDFNHKQLVDVLNTDYLPEKKTVLARANRLLSGQYLFQNEWDMERTSSIVEMPLDTIDWNYSPTPDLEFSYMLHRQAFLLDLVLAYLYTSDIEYINFLADYRLKYIDENKYSKRNKAFSWRTIDVALRLTNWIRINELLDIIGIEINPKIYTTMEEYYNYLTDHMDYNRIQSNWTAIESSAAILYANVFDINDGRYDKALAIYEACLENQVLLDGLQWEQSFMYHHEVLITSLHVLKTLGLKTPTIIRNKAIQLYQASLQIMRTDMKQINFGDSDYEDMGSLMLSAHKIIGIPGLDLSVKSSLFDFLLSGDTSDFISKEKKNGVEKHHLYEAGLGIIKDYSNNSTFMFSNGPLGGGHGHDDMLHIDWMVEGNNFLIDSGRYTYYEEQGSRLYFKRPQSHNTIVVDDMSYNKHLDSWSSAKVATPINEKVIFNKKANLFEGGHFGYSDRENLTFVNRKVIYIDNNIAVIVDSIKSNTVRRLTSNFVLEQDNFEIEDNKIIVHNDGIRMNIYTFDDVDISSHEAIVSYQYNTQFKTKRIEISSMIDYGHNLIFIAPLKVENIRKVPVFDDSNNLYADDVVECISYQIDDKEYFILVQHREPADSRRAYKVEDKLWYGRVIYFEKKGDNVIYSEKIY